MTVYSRDSEILEQHIYTALRRALAGWTDALEYFEDITPAQSHCVCSLCNDILDDFPLDNDRRQHQLLIRALHRSLCLNVATLDSCNEHCRYVRDDIHAFEGMTLSVPQLLAVIATSLCEAHPDPRINESFYEIQEPVDNVEECTFQLET